MEVRTDINTGIDIRSFDSPKPKVEPKNIFIYAGVGYGKTLASEGIIEEFHNAGYTILCLSDVKDNFEFGYSMFEPEAYYHIRHLRKIGKQPSAKKVKLYHPFTFAIPQDTMLPDINFYGFSLKSLKREEWGLISESAFESDTIRILLNACNSINNSDGLFSLLHYIQRVVIGKKEGKKIRADPKNFYLKVSGGTAKSLQDVSSYLQPFRNNYFLLPENSPYKLDWKKILNDNEHYHVFSTKWIDDDKLKNFCILALLRAIMRCAEDYAKKPILIYIPEIRYLCPFRPEGYKKFLAEGIKNAITTMRSKGKGISGLFDSQVWSGVDEQVRNTSNFTLYGQIEASDLEKLGKARRYTRDKINKLSNPEYRNSYLVHGQEDIEPFVMFFPSHCHSEPEYNFIDKYRKKYYNRMKNYRELVLKFREEFRKEESKFRDIAKKDAQREKEIQEQKRKEREENKSKSSEAEEKIEKAEEMEEKSKKQLMKLCYQMRQNNPDMSYRKIAEEMGLHHATVQNYIKEYGKILETENPEDD